MGRIYEQEGYEEGDVFKYGAPRWPVESGN